MRVFPIHSLTIHQTTSVSIFLAIDLKSFYASVECVDRHLDPLDANLVVADPSRTEKTICLAVSPSLKSFGLPGRARLFEVVERVRQINSNRRCRLPKGQFRGVSIFGSQLQDSSLAVDYIVAPPRMGRYMEISAKIYNIYLKYIAPEHIHVYSVDEVFIDASHYLRMYGQTPRELTMTLIQAILHATGITATAGIGSNLYLAKIAMDIVAKKKRADKDGVRIAELDELSYRQQLWGHQPLTDFWRVGHGYATRLQAAGIYTMGDVARASMTNEELFYRMFGVNAELLIDHAWGWEPCTMADIKAYRPESTSLSTGQVLQEPYSFEKARLVAKEMADSLALDLVEHCLVTDQLVLTVGYDVLNLAPGTAMGVHTPLEVCQDHYGRLVPKEAHGSINLELYTSSSRLIVQAVEKLFNRIVNPALLARRLTLAAIHTIYESQMTLVRKPVQLELFMDYEAEEKKTIQRKQELEREKRRQQAMLDIKRKWGKNAILKGMSLEPGATARMRNQQIGGHKA